MKPTALPILLALLALSFLGCNRLPEESGYLVIDPDRLDPQLLPYRFEQISENPLSCWPANLSGSGRSDMIRRALHFGLTGFIFTHTDSTSYSFLSQHNVAADTTRGRPVPYVFDADNDAIDEIALCYVSEDSLFFELVDPSEGLLRNRLMGVGHDRNLDGVAEIGAMVSNHLDINGDSFQECLVQVIAGYDHTPRAILLYDWRHDSLLWWVDLPCISDAYAAPIVFQQHPRPDTVVILSTLAPCNGYSIAPWDDCHSYLMCFSPQGILRWYRTLSAGFSEGYSVVARTDDGESRIVAHTWSDSLAPDRKSLEAFDLDGNSRASLPLPAEIRHLARLDRPGKGAAVAVGLQDNTALVLSADLKVILRLRSTTPVYPHLYADLLNLGSPQLVLHMADNWLLLLDDNMRPLARLDNATDIDVLTPRGEGSPTLMVRSGGHTLFFAPRSNSPIMVLLMRYRMELLFLAGILGTALAVTLFFQRRTRRNLDQIRLQKTELERIHHELKTTQQKLIEAEKYKQAKDIAGAFAHEIRNALFPARFALNRLGKADNAQTVEQAAVPARVHDLNRAVTRAIDLTTLISRYTKLETEFSPDMCDLPEVIASVLADMANPLHERCVAVTTDGPASAPVRFGRLHLGIVLTNLIRNSLDALTGQPGGMIDLRWSLANNTVLLTLTDNGPGIPSELRGRIFDAFFTTKPDTGTGLGLATVRRLLSLYGGDIRLDQTCPGASFVLTLPVPETSETGGAA